MKLRKKMTSCIENDDDRTYMMDLYSNYYGLVFSKIKNITNSINDVEDLVNDTFVKLIGKISLLRTLSDYKVTTYIVYTAKSTALDFVKRKGIQNKLMFYGEKEDISEGFYSKGDVNVDNLIIQKEELETLSNAILRLPEKDRDLLYYKYILEMNDVEIAGILNIAPGSVRQYLTRARRKAKELMEKEGHRSAEKSIGS